MMKIGIEVKSGSLEDVEAAWIQEVLQTLNWHMVDAAKYLGIDRRTLYRKLKKLGLSRPTQPSVVKGAVTSFQTDSIYVGPQGADPVEGDW
jgi:hypothetical protein